MERVIFVELFFKKKKKLFIEKYFETNWNLLWKEGDSLLNFPRLWDLGLFGYKGANGTSNNDVYSL